MHNCGGTETWDAKAVDLLQLYKNSTQACGMILICGILGLPDPGIYRVFITFFM